MTAGISFILFGPLRSGTTMTRLMLDNHPDLANAGEFDFLFDHATVDDRGNVRIDREKLFNNFAFQNFGFRIEPRQSDQHLLSAMLGQITARKPGIQSINIHHRINHVLKFLPGARIIKIHRDPRDVARSSIPMGFAATAYHGMRHWIATELSWERAKARLDTSRFMELRFEDLLRHQERELERICNFMGVDYSDAMLDYARSSTYDAPDPAMAYKWKGAMPQHEVAACTSLAPDLIAARGYEVPQPVRSPGLLDRVRLEARNKLGLWAFHGHRYGWQSVVAEKVSRRLGFTGWHGRVINEMNAITLAHLK